MMELFSDRYWFFAFTVFISISTTNLIMAAANARIFPARNAKAYWAVQIALIIFYTLAKPTWDAMTSFVLGTFLPMVPLYAFRNGTALAKTIVFIVGQVLLFIAEMLVGLLWIFMTDSAVMDIDMTYAYFPEFLITIAVHTVIMVALFYPFAKFCRNVFTERHREGGAPSEKLQGWSWGVIFVCFPCVQLVLVAMLIWVSFVMMKDDAAFVAATLLVLVVCAVVDVLLFMQMRSYADKQVADMAAKALQEQADAYLARAAGMQAELRAAARLRHDLRNHLHVVEGLCERGEVEQARAYLDEASAELLQGDR